ncbi:hypothetical protein NDR87_26840 [Nocardia sp. CDC159]|uniref:Uncharacterized protein n=1 Tax=Nocardia pulmonis TaxID=2951408 RepID=A0A9X2EBC7_9NOCA|nr:MULTISPECIES: hypothetical protein [Nocardia]MCM6777110.1 hypothetical protein [Nocardia pulmonis]MCM6789995.1 hypothetical protein [Nocardia sp. CDC159]
MPVSWDMRDSVSIPSGTNPAPNAWVALGSGRGCLMKCPFYYEEKLAMGLLTAVVALLGGVVESLVDGVGGLAAALF